MKKLSAMRSRQYAAALLSLSLTVMLSGCVVRTYPYTKDRVDQDLSSGNRGYLMGQASQADKSTRKTARTTQALEIELHSPIKFEKIKKTGVIKSPEMESSTQEGNSGYISQSISGDITESRSSSVSLERYTVLKNDTLQKISQKYYGTSKKWMKIFEANKDVLKGPNKIYPGQVINVPVEPSKETKENLK